MGQTQPQPFAFKRVVPTASEGHVRIVQLLKKNGGVVIAVGDPAYPNLQVQPVGTFTPSQLAGHATATHTPDKNGCDNKAPITPEKPALQLQPCATLTPKVLAGQATWQKR